MKTAISLPDELFAEAEKTANSLGISRSRLFARALEEFIDHHRQAGITKGLNEVYEGMHLTAEAGITIAGLESMRELTKNDSW